MRMLLISCLLIGSISCGPVDKDYSDNSAGSSFVWQPFSSGSATGAARAGYGFDSSAAGGSYDGSARAGYGFDSSAAGGSYDGSARAGYGFDSSAVGGSYVGGYDSSVSAGHGFDSSAVGGSYVGGYDRSASAGHGFDSSAVGGSYVGGYDRSASAGYGFDSNAVGGSYVGGYDSSASVGYGFDSSAAGGYDGSTRASVGGTWGAGGFYGYDASNELEPVFSDVSDLEPVYTFSSRSSYQRGRALFAQTRYTPGEPVPQQMPMRRIVSKTSKQSSPVKAPSKGAF